MSVSSGERSAGQASRWRRCFASSSRWLMESMYLRSTQSSDTAHNVISRGVRASWLAHALVVGRARDPQKVLHDKSRRYAWILQLDPDLPARAAAVVGHHGRVAHTPFETQALTIGQGERDADRRIRRGRLARPQTEPTFGKIAG